MLGLPILFNNGHSEAKLGIIRIHGLDPTASSVSKPYASLEILHFPPRISFEC